MKKTFYTELAYGLGLAALALGVALMEAADLGVSMVVAPAYLLYLKLSPSLPFVTFGMAEYVLQAVLLLALTLVLRRFRLSYLFSFVTAVVYGFLLDGAMLLVALLPAGGLAARIGLFALGVLVCALGVSLVFHTYLSPEVYELFVKELSRKYGFELSRCKTCYDCISCAVGVAMSFAFFGFGRFEGVRLGTVVCALINGRLIGGWTKLLESRFDFRDGLPLRRFFEGEKDGTIAAACDTMAEKTAGGEKR